MAPLGSARTLARNGVSQVVGRMALSLGRMLAALMIVRLLGAERFGAYSLILSFIFLFEWLADFGQTDICVRDILQSPGSRSSILAALAALKLAHGLLLCLLLPAALWLMRYPAPIVRSGMVGGLGLLAVAGAQIFRTVFKLNMRMERDILAELASLAVMLPLTFAACVAGAGIEVLTACYVASRFVYAALLAGLARRDLGRVDWGAHPREAVMLFLRAAPVGGAGLMVALYDSLAIVLLSKLASLAAIAQYAAATRFIFPVIIVVQALNSAFYPPLAASLREGPARFLALQQTVLEMSLFVAGGLFCVINADARFLMALMGPRLAPAAGVLQILSWVALARSITTSMSPLLVVARATGRALGLTGLSIAFQIGAIVVLVPRFGIVGAAFGYLATELLLGVVPVSWLGQRAAGIRIDWRRPVKLVASAALAAGLCRLAPGLAGPWPGLIGALAFLVFAIVSGGASPRAFFAVARAIRGGEPAAALPARAG